MSSRFCPLHRVRAPIRRLLPGLAAWAMILPLVAPGLVGCSGEAATAETQTGSGGVQAAATNSPPSPADQAMAKTPPIAAAVDPLERLPVYPGSKPVQSLSWRDGQTANLVYACDTQPSKVVSYYEEQLDTTVNEMRLSDRTDFELRSELDDGRLLLVRVRTIPPSLRGNGFEGETSIVLNVQPGKSDLPEERNP